MTPQGRNGIPRASRPFESPMTLAIRNSRATVAPNPSLVAAGADVAEADTAQRIAADPSVIDAERHPLYGHGVQQRCDCLSRDLSALVSDPPHVQGHAASCPVRLAEYERLGRLGRWQRPAR